MCGVCGVIRPGGAVEADLATVATLNHQQRHRGPDDAGQWSQRDAVLGQTRLAIVDLTDGGRQPFVADDGSVAVVFNGEIYNHEELRREFALTTMERCDGAILPELWRRLGTSMFATLRGMFAIAVHDLRDRTVTLARDPLGIKPLHWTRTADGALAFASEAGTLLPLLGVRRLNAPALAHYLMYGAMGRDQAPFADIEQVPANGWTQWDVATNRRDGVVRAGLFADLPRTGPRELRGEFLRSVALHLNSDVPMALLLSSGLDSSAIAWACAELGTSLTCVTVDMGAGTSEQVGARGVAKRFGHTHCVVSAIPDDNLVSRYLSSMQRPSIDGLNVFLVSQAISSLGIKVALSGLGGDEVLAGYPTFRLLRYLPLLRATDALSITPFLARLYGQRRHKVAQLLDPSGPRDARALGALGRRVLMDSQLRSLAPWALPGTPARTEGRDCSARTLSLTELDGYLGGTLLPDADAYSMAGSLEMRVPYVDVDFTRAALAVDVRRGVGKQRFAMALGDRGLAAIARRRKQGFTLPMDQWMRTGPLAAEVRAARSADSPVRALLRPHAVDDVLTSWLDGRLSWSRAWSLVALDAWLRRTAVDCSVALPDVLPDGLLDPLSAADSGHGRHVQEG